MATKIDKNISEKNTSEKNKYVDFISDEDFEECVETAMKNYEERSKIRTRLMRDETSKVLGRANTTTDEFKTLFDIHGYGMESLEEEWKPFEINRSIEVSENSVYIEFHLNILSRVKGWELINRGKHPSVSYARVLKNDDNSIYIEIRNNHQRFNNTPKSAYEIRFKKELGNPDIEIYSGYIVSKGHIKNINNVFYVGDKNENKIIKEISGDVIYKIVTGQDSAFYDTYKALRLCLKEKYPCKLNDNEDDEKTLDEFQERIF